MVDVPGNTSNFEDPATAEVWEAFVGPRPFGGNWGDALGWLVNTAVFIGAGRRASYWYYREASAALAAVHKAGLSRPEMLAQLRRKGGTRPWTTAALFALYLAVSLLLGPEREPAARDECAAPQAPDR